MRIGAIFAKSTVGPKLAYCPKTSSMKKSGIPAHISIVAYGIKKAAEIESSN